jgi:hypothetical protein
MALQRTRRPRFRSGRSLRSLGSPLNARSLGGVRRTMIGLGMILPTYLFASADLDRELEFRCSGMDAYEIRGTYHVDAGGGSIRSKSDAFAIGFALGPMIAEDIPQARRPGLRWMKTEPVGNATLRYGYDVRRKQVRVTVVGAPLGGIINLAGKASDQDRLLSIARVLATSRCQWKNLSSEKQRQ